MMERYLLEAPGFGLQGGLKCCFPTDLCGEHAVGRGLDVDLAAAERGVVLEQEREGPVTLVGLEELVEASADRVA